MTRLRLSRTAIYLGLIVLLGIAARVPGLFWGYHLFGTEVVVLNSNEPQYSLPEGPPVGFPRGLATSLDLLTRLLEAVGLAAVVRWADYGFFAGRVVSLIYAGLTLVVLFRLARSVFKDDRIGLLAAFFLALADLHVTYSHMGQPDIAATFWFYLALASAHAALERGSRQALLVSAVSTGAAAAIRFQLMSLIPLLWWVARSRRRALSGLLLLATVSASLLVFSGLVFDASATLALLRNLAFRGAESKKLFLPFVYLAVLFVGVGLPVFLLAGYGLIRFARAKWATVRGWRDLLADNQIPVCLSPVAAFLQMSAVALWAHYYAVVLTPFVAMLAAYGCAQVTRRSWGPVPAHVAARGLVAFTGIYLAVQVASVEAYFVDDPLEKAGRWLRARVPPGETLSSFMAAVPPEYPAIAEWKANYLVLSARGYRRYLFKDFLPTRLTGRDLTAEDIAAGRLFGMRVDDLHRVQKLFGGELPYRLVKAIGLRFYTPELLLTNALWYPPPHVDEVLIYERPRQAERVVEVLTPSRRDYLLTLHAWQPSRLEPGQKVRLDLNGTPLPVRLGPELTHLLLPRALVSSPYSRLGLSSDRLLPHLPLDFVRRVRPVGQEFVVDALVDGDHMLEGFSKPEIRADGAAWRWTTGAGQVLLPGPGASGPWRRVAVRLGGRPGAPPQPVVVFLGPWKLGEAVVSGEERTVEFPVPPGAFPGELGTLEIISPTGRSPTAADSGEARRVGVAVYWVRLTRAERFQPFDQPVAGMSLPRAWRPLFGLGVPYRVEAASFPSDGLTLRGDLFGPPGSGRSAILLAHGAGVLGRKHGLYLGLARRLAEKGYWVLLPDFRGYGESERPARIAAARDLDFTRDLAVAIGYLERRLGVRDVVLVGHSFGADVGIALAARDPRVRKLVAISPARRVYQRFLTAPGGPQILRDRLAAEMGIAPEQIPVELIEPIVAPITIDNYVGHSFRPPFLLVDGELEDEADLRFLRSVYRRMKGEKAYVTIPNADHYFGVRREVEERDPPTLDTLADVIDGWIREGARWSRSGD